MKTVALVAALAVPYASYAQQAYEPVRIAYCGALIAFNLR